jgi:hypothetical protein
MPKTTITHVGPFMDLLEQMGAAAGSSFADVEVAEQVWVMVQVRALEADAPRGPHTDETGRRVRAGRAGRPRAEGAIRSTGRTATRLASSKARQAICTRWLYCQAANKVPHTEADLLVPSSVAGCREG